MSRAKDSGVGKVALPGSRNGEGEDGLMDLEFKILPLLKLSLM